MDSRIAGAKSEVLASLSAVRTLLDRFPALLTIDFSFPNTSLGFMLNVLDIIGITQEDIIKFLCKILAGKGSDGLLYAIEQAMKAILLANIKNMLTCSLNPFIPDKLMYQYENQYGKVVGGEGIELDLDGIDLYGLLSNCPVSNGGGLYYFDAKDSYYNEDGYPKVPGYTINDVWKSGDFNAYLWYVVNKGSGVDPEARKLYWDNRCRHRKKFTKNANLKAEFFNALTADEVKAYNKTHKKCKKKQICRCEYSERHASNGKARTNLLHFWVNPDEYYRKRKIKIMGIPVKFNKTLFELNFDYIYSLKLLESKTLIASIVNAVLGLSMSISLDLSLGIGEKKSYSAWKDVVAGRVSEIVKKMIQSEDMYVDDCYFTFDNEEYDKLLEESVQKHEGVFKSKDAFSMDDYQRILNQVNEIDSAADLQQTERLITNLFNDIAYTAGSPSYSEEGSTTSTEPVLNFNAKFGLDFIYEIINQTITQLVMQLLSPKVAMLFAINQAIMGDIDPQSSELWKMNWEQILKNFKNVIIQTIKQIITMILKQMLAWILEKIAPLLALFIAKLLLETLNNYITLLKQLLSLCGLGWGRGSSSTGIKYGDGVPIEDVDGADIVPGKNIPKNDC